MRIFRKSITICLSLVILAGLFAGCSTAKPEAATMPEKTAAEKAMAMYAELLEACPAVPREEGDCLEDLTFGYDENLAKFGKHYDTFAVLDLDRDGIPELIATTIVNRGWVPVSIFRYQAAENQLQLLKDPLDPEAHGTFEHMSTAGGSYALYVCKDNHLHSTWGGDTPIGFQEENHAYAVNPEGLAAVDCPVSIFSGEEAHIAVDFSDILRTNDAENRNSVFG